MAQTTGEMRRKAAIRREARMALDAERVKAKMPAETYKKHAADIASILDWIGDELEVHEERAAKEPGNRGFVGDLGHVRAKLRETLAFLSGVEERVIDQELEDLRA